ncbi:MAG: TerB family tellurite resistance protein [Candidatus Thermoplasmatota archaeon]|nr:TerB family tellurite resistance protein [Candidatus Thermoplasmatota archaeon]
MPHTDEKEGEEISLLFLAMSAADLKILKEEIFISEKCAVDYGIKKEEWNKLLNRSFTTYFNEGEEAVKRAVDHLNGSMSLETKKELVEDLLAVALIDNNYHRKEKALLKMIASAFGVDSLEADTNQP